MFRQAQLSDFPAVQQLLELYQYELSDIWHQDLDGEGRYGYDLSRHRRAERFFAHVALDASQYVGFALVAPAAITRVEGSWMEQFFVLKRYRRSGVGLKLARHVFCSHPGPWEIGQMPGNVAATAFWRRVVTIVTGGDFKELNVAHDHWHGVVQQFDVRAAS